MPIPLIPLILGAGALVSSGWGVAKGARGASDIAKAKRISAAALQKGQQSYASLDEKRTEVNRAARYYAERLNQARKDTFARFVEFVEALGQRGSMEAIEALEEVNVTQPQIREYKVAAIEAHRVATGAASMVGAATGASVGTTGLVGLLGSASTGTAISGLTGAAATNATLAWLGGGSLAAGGGGMALGTVVLGGITVAPAVLVGGFVLAGRGHKALTEAKEYEAQVDAEVAKIGGIKNFMDRVITRIEELTSLVDHLEAKANEALDRLNPATFDLGNEAHVKTFQQAGLLVKALAEVMKTPVLDADGRLTGESLKVQVKYKELAE